MQNSLSDCQLITSALCADSETSSAVLAKLMCGLAMIENDLAMIENLVCAAFTDSQGCTLKDELVSIWSSLIDLILKLSKPSESWYRAGIKHWYRAGIKHWLST